MTHCFRCQSSEDTRIIITSISYPQTIAVCTNCWKNAASKVSEYNKQARKFGGRPGLQILEWFIILYKSEGHCCYCKKYTGFQALITEHVLPLSLGGNNTHDNIGAACNQCNSEKGKRDLATWYRSREASYLLEQLQEHLNLSKHEIKNLAIKTLATMHGIVAPDDLAGGRAEE